jgi:hypothetical protein
MVFTKMVRWWGKWTLSGSSLDGLLLFLTLFKKVRATLDIYGRHALLTPSGKEASSEH